VVFVRKDAHTPGEMALLQYSHAVIRPKDSHETAAHVIMDFSLCYDSWQRTLCVIHSLSPNVNLVEPE